MELLAEGDVVAVAGATAALLVVAGVVGAAVVGAAVVGAAVVGAAVVGGAVVGGVVGVAEPLWLAVMLLTTDFTLLVTDAQPASSTMETIRAATPAIVLRTLGNPLRASREFLHLEGCADWGPRQATRNG